MNYKLIEAHDIDLLEDLINELSAEGWLLQAFSTAPPTLQSSQHYYAVMVYERE